MLLSPSDKKNQCNYTLITVNNVDICYCRKCSLKPIIRHIKSEQKGYSCPRAPCDTSHTTYVAQCLWLSGVCTKGTVVQKAVPHPKPNQTGFSRQGLLMCFFNC